MWDQGGQPWPQWPLSSQQQWMQSFQHQHDPGQWKMRSRSKNFFFFSPIRKTMHDCLWLSVDMLGLFVVGFFFLGQVDWAALAQAWIAQKESTGTQPHNIQPNGQDLPGHDSGPPGPPAPPTNHGAFQGEPGFGRMWQPGKRWRGWRGYFDLTVGFPESHFSGQFCSN